MEESFIKEIPIIDLNKEQSDLAIIDSIVKAQENLRIAQHNYEFAHDDLIDYYTYQIKSEQAKIDYLLKVAKNKNIEIK